MKHKRSFLILSLGMAFSSHSWADATQPSSYPKCMHISESITDKMTCMTKALDEKDKECQQYYYALLKGFHPDQSDMLRKAQEAWEKYRDTNCTFYASIEQDSSKKLKEQACKFEMTDVRLGELKFIFKKNEF